MIHDIVIKVPDGHQGDEYVLASVAEGGFCIVHVHGTDARPICWSLGPRDPDRGGGVPMRQAA